MKLFGILTGLSVLVIAILSIALYISYNNQYIRLKNQYDAQKDVDRAIFDKVWKVIQSQAGVASKYSDDFRKNYTSIMNSRNYGGEMMKWIQESNPNFTPDLYAALMNTISSERDNFTNNQKKLISIHKELSDVVMTFPGSLILSSKEIPILEIVTSTQTEQVFSTHKEDSVKIF